MRPILHKLCMNSRRQLVHTACHQNFSPIIGLTRQRRSVKLNHNAIFYVPHHKINSHFSDVHMISTAKDSHITDGGRDNVRYPDLTPCFFTIKVKKREINDLPGDVGFIEYPPL